MQNKVCEINNEKKFLREKLSKLISFFPKKKASNKNTKKKKKTIIAWDPNVRLSVRASILAPPERKREREREKKGDKKFFAWGGRRRRRNLSIQASTHNTQTWWGTTPIADK